jgi:uncharacterized protein (TIGR03000 family)
MFGQPRSFLAAATLAATLALLTPNAGSAQFFRPVFGFPGWGYYPWGYYPTNPYPIGNFPPGTRFYPGMSPLYNSIYNQAYYPQNPALTNGYSQNPALTNGTATAPYRPSTVEYNPKPAAPPDEPGSDKPASSTQSSSTTTSSRRATGNRPVVREYNVPKEAIKPSPPDQPARIDVEAPARAKIYCDGAKTNLAGTIRQFVTPALSPGREYFYELRAEWKEGERTVSVTKRVTFHAGDRVTVSFLDKPSAPESLPEPKAPPQ